MSHAHTSSFPSSPEGVIAVISLLVGNGVNQVLAKIGFSMCSDATKSTHVAFLLDNVTNITCGDLKGEIAVSLAMTSGLIMVSVHYVYLFCCMFNIHS